MSTLTASNIQPTSTAARPFRRGATLVVAAIVVIAAAIALSVWLLVQSPTHHHANVTSPDVNNVQKVGVAGQGGYPAQGHNQVCQPAPADRFC